MAGEEFQLHIGQGAELAEGLVEAGAMVRWDEDLPGTRRFYTEDPWGNRLELLAS